MQAASSKKKCPECECPSDAAEIMPNPREDPAGWFRLVDVDGNGSLSKEEVVEAVKSTICCNWRQFAEELNDVFDMEGQPVAGEGLWRRWDHDGNGTLSCAEFIAHGGLLDYVMENYPVPEVRPVPRLEPDNRESYRAFFEYWDSPENGGNRDKKWDRNEIKRALKKSFRNWHFSTGSLDEVIDMTNVVCDPDGDGEITLEEFLMRDGWAETLCASIQVALRTQQK